jgi:hypothetical protein
MYCTFDTVVLLGGIVRRTLARRGQREGPATTTTTKYRATLGVGVGLAGSLQKKNATHLAHIVGVHCSVLYSLVWESSGTLALCSPEQKSSCLNITPLHSSAICSVVKEFDSDAYTVIGRPQYQSHLTEYQSAGTTFQRKNLYIE